MTKPLPNHSPHILIVVALAAEARPMIQHWGLKRVADLGRLERWQSDTHTLVISGVGPSAAAAATAALLASLGDDQHKAALIVNIGWAGCRDQAIPVGALALVHRVSAVDTEREFVPDILFRQEVDEAWLATHSRPVTKQTPAHAATLVDMEAAGFLEATRMFLSAHHAMVIKIVSDHLEGRRIALAPLQGFIEAHLPTIDQLIDSAVNIGHTVTPTLPDKVNALYRKVCDVHRLTESQQGQLRDLLLAAEIVGKSRALITASLEKVLREPPRHKRERNALFETLLDELAEAHA